MVHVFSLYDLYTTIYNNSHYSYHTWTRIFWYLEFSFVNYIILYICSYVPNIKKLYEHKVYNLMYIVVVRTTKN